MIYETIGFPKVKKCVSKKLRDSAKGEDCQLNLEGICNRDPSTVVWCHIRKFSMAGISQKPHDFLGYYGCDACHRAQESRDDVCGDDDLLRAIMRSLSRLYEKGILKVQGDKNG